MGKIQAIRGMNDILPDQTPAWQFLERTVAKVVAGYGYQEIRMPIVEQTELFKRSIGEVTDIVEKEMYTFADRNGDSLTLRPEGTAGCVRAGEQHGLLFNQVRRLWYTGPMFRHERPQKGRYRQFHQIGVECFGMQGPDIDAEVLLMTARLWRELGLRDEVTLEINSLGTSDDRRRYREALVRYLDERRDQLDEDSLRRLESNPLRILDSKNPDTQALLSDAPELADFLDDDSRQHFSELRALLDAAGLSYRVNPRLVRGLDYYGKTVFEWVTDRLGAQGTVCAGGRYDGLVAQLGGRDTPAVGFAMGIERLILLLQTVGVVAESEPAPAQVYLLSLGADTRAWIMAVAEQLRDELPGAVIVTHCGGGSFKSQMKKADRSGARLGIIAGEDEISRNELSVKDLREGGEQITVAREQLAGHCMALLDSGQG